MEPINYTSGMLWLGALPLLVYIAYKFIALNISHFEENIKDK